MPEAALRRLPVVAFAALCAAAVAAFVRFPTRPNYDSLTVLLWARDLWDGVTPQFDAYRAPTQHPLLLLVGLVIEPLGDAAPRVLVALSIAGLLALVAGVYRLGRVAGGLLAGLVAGAIIASRLNLALLAAIGFLDIPYCALVAWAAALEAERPRRGGAVWVLLVLAGLLRPEAWLLALAYAVWIGAPLDARGRVKAAALFALAPAIWCAVDLAMTGDPLFSLTYTDASAASLSRDRPLLEVPWLMLRLLAEILKWPVVLIAVAGIVLAVRRRERGLIVPGALVVLTCSTYLVIASGGLATVYRYLLMAGVGLAVFAAYALAGWRVLPAGDPARRRWAIAASVLLAAGALFVATHTSPRNAAAQLDDRSEIRADLLALLRKPEVERARQCGPISVPNHKLIPEIRWALGLPEGAVVARSDTRVPEQTRGVAIVIDRRFEHHPSLDIYEVPHDGGWKLQIPPPGLVLVGGNRRFAAYVGCG